VFDGRSREGTAKSSREVERHELRQRERRGDLVLESLDELPALFLAVPLVVDEKPGFLEPLEIPHDGAAAAFELLLELLEGAAAR
jgi:hypothetical protein